LLPARTLDFSLLLALALTMNLPLGFMREGTRKFSVRWFVYVHLSIPFIIALRIHYGISWRVIPLTIACAVAGQLLGGRLRRRYT
jgi:hypothetical protein